MPETQADRVDLLKLGYRLPYQINDINALLLNRASTVNHFAVDVWCILSASRILLYNLVVRQYFGTRIELIRKSLQ
jgi:hypothetical protein